MELNKKVAVITGATHGLGFEIAKTYAMHGATLALCSRSIEDLEKASYEISQHMEGSQALMIRQVDVANSQQAAEFVSDIATQFGDIDILVNNAGIYGPIGMIEKVCWEEWIRALEINLLGSILMAREVLPHFKRKKNGKIIQISGGGATKPMPNFSSYAVAKAGVVRFAETLAMECVDYGIDVNAIAPGALNTRMLDQLLSETKSDVGEQIYKKALEQKSKGGTSLSMPSDLALFLASSASDGITGKLISAVWDNWKDWIHHVEELRKTDAYTLRRIIGADRGIEWGDK